MIASTLALARHGREHGYAVPAVNVFDHASLRGVVDAAEATSSPLIVQISVKTLRSLGLTFVTEMFKQVAAPAAVPLALHLDHCPELGVALSVIRAGWSSVLFDVSDLGLEVAERETSALVALAHAAGVDVESEIENILGVEDDVGSDVATHAYSVEVLAEVAERTRVDLLAPQLGTAHGRYACPPVLRPERARELAGLTESPIVLHGGTGLSEQDFAAFIDAGVSKINISTAVKGSYLGAVGDYHASNGKDPLAMADRARRAVYEEIEAHISVFGSAGHARSAGGSAAPH